MLEQLEQWMREALIEGQRAARAREIPVGAVLVANGGIVGRGYNQPVSARDPTAHAEIVALRDAAQRMDNYRLVGCTLVVTIEPCLMCIGALVHARIDLLVFGAPEPKAGAVMSAMRALEHPRLNHRFPVIAGVLEGECRDLMQGFFRQRRDRAAAARPSDR